MKSSQHGCSDDCPGRRFDERIVAYDRSSDESCPTDEMLLSQWAAQGCQVCFRWWVERVYRDPRYRGVRATLIAQWPSADIDGLIADAIVSVHEKKPTPDFAAAYLRQMVWNLACKDCRHGLAVRTEYRDDVGDVEEISQQTLAQRLNVSEDDLYEGLARCLETLSQLLKEAIRSHYWERREIKEIATQLGIEKDACYKRINRGRQAIFECLRRRLNLA